jgi:ABC-2 type transport system ATP-binding protein
VNTSLAISVSGLSKRYGKVEAVKSISFDVNRGEIFALLGPNGSGKTTTLEILMGLRPYEQGKITYPGAAAGSGKLPRIGAVFQTRMYYDNLTVREHIKHYTGFYRVQSDIGKYLALVNLTDKLDAQYRVLSGGQKQQLSILLALVNDPEILFLDEPSTALDPQVRLRIWDLIRSLKSEGKTVVFSTHYIEEAEALADRVSILSKGELVVTASPAEIIRRYNEGYNVELSFDEEVSVAALEDLGAGSVRCRGGVYTFSASAIDDALFQLVKGIADKFMLSRVNIGKSSLQTVFVRITEERSTR